MHEAIQNVVAILYTIVHVMVVSSPEAPFGHADTPLEFGAFLAYTCVSGCVVSSLNVVADASLQQRCGPAVARARVLGGGGDRDSLAPDSNHGDG